MRQLLRTIALLLLTYTGVSAQNSTVRYAGSIPTPTNIERYGIDYELKTYVFVNGDSTILNQIDLTAIEHLRSPSENVEVLDATTGQIIVLFHTKKKKSVIDKEKDTKPTNL